MELAKQNPNDVKKYIVIDSRKSTFEWMKNNVTNSELSKIIDFDKINWELISNKICEDVYKRVIDIWNSGINCVSEIIRITKFSKGAVRDALSRFVNLLDNVDNEEELNNKIRRHKKVDVLKDGVVIKSYNSISECVKDSEKDFGVLFTHTGIWLVCSGRQKSHRNYQFQYSENVRSNFINKK